MKAIPAVILGLGVNGYGIVRSLACKKIPIYGVYYRNNKKEIGRYSKYIIPIKASDAIKEPEKYLLQLINLSKRINGKPFLIPESDALLSFISDNRKILSEYFLFNIPHENIVTKILEKSGNMELAIKHDVLIPKTIYPNNRDDVNKVLNDFKFPIIIKPLTTFSNTFPGNKKNIVIDNKVSLVKLFSDNEGLYSNCVIQEIIIGLDGNIVICSCYLSRDSEPLGVYTGRKIRQYLPDYGITSYGISEYIPEVEEISVNFLKKMRYTGLGTLEFARDISNGKYYFIELNGRSYYHNMLFTDCNINLSYIAYCDAVGIECEYICNRQKEGIIWIDFSNDISSFWRKHKENKIRFKEWLSSVTKARSFAIFDKTDFLPFLYSVLLLIKSIFKVTQKELRNSIFNNMK